MDEFSPEKQQLQQEQFINDCLSGSLVWSSLCGLLSQSRMLCEESASASSLFQETTEISVRNERKRLKTTYFNCTEVTAAGCLAVKR